MAKHGYDDLSDWNIRSPKGCSNCLNVGYLGRTAIVEYLNFDHQLLDLLEDQSLKEFHHEMDSKLLGERLVDQVCQFVRSGRVDIDQAMALIHEY